MANAVHKIAVVIPTIGRYPELRRMLKSLAGQTRLPDEVVIVDQDETSRRFAREFPQLNIQVVVKPGATPLKRNAGLKAVRHEMTLIGFMDDDIVLEPTAIEATASFWERARPGLGGTSCNYVNPPPRSARALKEMALVSACGLYDHRPGSVSRSGFHTPAAQLVETTYTQWLFSVAFYARPVLDEFHFDEWFEGYSYLEDLDFSYQVSKKYRLAVVADSRFYHYYTERGRPNTFLFGKQEVLNRLHFVKKHRELSPALCWLSLSVRMLMTARGVLGKGARLSLQRLAGNLAAVFIYFTKGLRPV